MTVEIESRSPEETQEVGRVLGLHTQPGDLILLVGELGSGKTTLTQGIGQGLGVSGSVRSPTFVLVAQHQGRIPLYHVDLYRVRGLEEALELGLDDEALGDGVSVVEWADRAPEAFSPERLEVHMEHHGESGRFLQLEARGSRHQALLRAVEEARKTVGQGTSKSER